MRVKRDGQQYWHWPEAPKLKIVEEYEQKYKKISEILDENPKILQSREQGPPEVQQPEPPRSKGRLHQRDDPADSDCDVGGGAFAARHGDSHCP